MLAEFCRLVGRRFGEERSLSLPSAADLSPRQKQTLELLLRGDSEKQIAYKLGISRHTVHVYVKDLYKRFDVNSRGELLALWVRR